MQRCVVPHTIGTGAVGGARLGVKKIGALVLKTLPGMGVLDDKRLEGKMLRQIERGQVDPAHNTSSGKLLVADFMHAVVFKTAKDERQFAANKNQVNLQTCPSLEYVDIGHSSVI